MTGVKIDQSKMRHIFILALVIASVLAMAPSCQNNLLAVGNTDNCNTKNSLILGDGEQICQVDCAKIDGITCTIPSELKQKWALSLKAQLAKLDRQRSESISRSTTVYKVTVTALEEAHKNAKKALKEAEERGADANELRYAIEDKALELSQAHVLYKADVANINHYYAQFKRDINSVAMASMNFQSSKTDYETLKLSVEKLSYQNALYRFSLTRSQGKSVASLVYLQKKRQANLARSYGLTGLAGNLDVVATNWYVQKRKTLDDNYASAQKDRLATFNYRRRHIIAKAKELKKLAAEKKKHDAQKSLEAEKAKLKAVSVENWRSLSKRLANAKKIYGKRMDIAKKAGKVSFVNRLRAEFGRTVRSMNHLRTRLQKKTEKALTAASKAAIQAINDLQKRTNDDLATIQQMTNSLGNAMVPIPNNYVPPKLSKGVLTINFAADVVVGDYMKTIYDTACIIHSSARAKLQRLMGNLQENIKSGVFPFNDTAAVTLSKNDRFIDYWTHLKEFCQKLTDGLVPKDRALATFFSNNWPKGSNIPILIAEVNVTENAQLTGTALFFEQLATWATTRDTLRCLCGDIVDLMRTGIAPDLKIRLYSISSHFPSE
jgi:hypothetical protein